MLLVTDKYKYPKPEVKNEKKKQQPGKQANKNMNNVNRRKQSSRLKMSWCFSQCEHALNTKTYRFERPMLLWEELNDY